MALRQTITDELTAAEQLRVQEIDALADSAAGEALGKTSNSVVQLTPGGGGGGGGDLKADGTVPLTANWDVGAFQIRALTFQSDVVTGTAPFTVASTTVVPNLNASLLEGNAASAFALALGADDNYVTDAEKTVIGNTSGTNTGDQTNITGNAGTVTTIAGLAPDTATTQASQPNITSLGTLTALQVDNINVNGNTVSSTSGSIVLSPTTGLSLSPGNSVITLAASSELRTTGNIIFRMDSDNNETDRAFIIQKDVGTEVVRWDEAGMQQFTGAGSITTTAGDLTLNPFGDVVLGANNLTMTGSLGATGSRLTKGWFTDLQVTNAIAGSITGNAATVSTITGLAPDTATTQATQANITSAANLTTVGTLTVGNATAIVDAASATTAGKAELATSAEVDTGTDTTRAVTPEGIKSSKNVPNVVPGTSGNVLTSDGTDWTSAAGGGGGETIVTADAADALIDISTVISFQGNNARIQYADVDSQAYWIVKVPSGGTSISSMEVVYISDLSGNDIILRTRISHIDIANAPTNANIDTNGADQTITVSVTNPVDIATIAADNYNQIGTLAEGNVLFIQIIRKASLGGDTYNAVWNMLGIRVTFV